MSYSSTNIIYNPNVWVPESRIFCIYILDRSRIIFFFPRTVCRYSPPDRASVMWNCLLEGISVKWDFNVLLYCYFNYWIRDNSSAWLERSLLMYTMSHLLTFLFCSFKRMKILSVTKNWYFNAWWDYSSGISVKK